MILASSNQSPAGQQVYALSGAEDAGNQESQRDGKAKSPGHVEGPGWTAGLRRGMRTPGCGWSPKEEKSSRSRLPRLGAAVGKLPPFPDHELSRHLVYEATPHTLLQP